MQGYHGGKGVLRYILEKYFVVWTTEATPNSGANNATVDGVDHGIGVAHQAAMSLAASMTCNELMIALVTAYHWSDEKSCKGPLHKMFFAERVTVNGVVDSPAGMLYRLCIGQGLPAVDAGMEPHQEHYCQHTLKALREDMDAETRELCVPFDTAANVWKDFIRSMSKRRSKVMLHRIDTTPRGLFHDEPMAVVKAAELKVTRKRARELIEAEKAMEDDGTYPHTAVWVVAHGPL
jgi:hypothetical protein